MKALVLMCAILATCALAMGAEQPSGVVYVGHERVDAALAKNGTLVRAKDLLVLGAHRAEAGRVELHEKETDVFYIVEGQATFVTGGKMIGGRLVRPGQWFGTGIEGGQVHHLRKGDVIVIPAGTPHWYKEVPHSVSYFVVKVLAP